VEVSEVDGGGVKILWLTNLRPVGTIDFYGPLMHEMEKRAEVTVVRRQYADTEGAWCRNVMLSKGACPPIVDPVMANTFDVVICDAMYSYMTEPWGQITAPLKAVLLGDMHGQMVQEYAGAAWSRFGFRLFLPIYIAAMQKFHSAIYADPRMIIRWFPYWVDTEVYRDYGLPKDIKALMTGVIHHVVYGLRDRINTAMAETAGYLRIPRPAEIPGSPNVWPLGADYGQLLSRAQMAFASTSIYNYPVTKLYEICACRTALACDWIPEMGDLGWVPEVNMVPLSEEDRALGDTIKHWLDQPERLQEIADAGHRLITERYTAPKRADDLLDILTAALAGRPA